VLLRRAVMTRSALLVACGPTVATDDDGSTTAASTTMLDITDEVTSSSDVDGRPFIEDPDGPCFGHECDLWSQDCSDGYKCAPRANDGGDSWNAVLCAPIDPHAVDVGDPCVAEGSGVSGIDDCGISAMCWGVDPLTLEGTCVGFCGGSEANRECPNGLECIVAFEGTLILCLPPCDPLAPSCADDEACMSNGNHPPSGVFACLPTPPFVPHGYGKGCDGELQLCAPGLACAPPEHVPGCDDIGCCTTVGDLAAPPVCPDVTQTCIPFEPEATEGLCFCGVQ
jgi:hypothetical protein